MNESNHWANLIENDLRDDQSLAEQDRVIRSYVEQIQAEVFGECARIATAHIGAAARARQQKGFTFRHLSEDAAESIRSEERGETIAAQEIAGEIKRRMDALIVSGHADLCDVNDLNPDGIKKPCNCGFERHP